MAKSAMEILDGKDKQNQTFSIGDVFSTSFSIAPYDLPIFFLMTMAASLLPAVASFALTIKIFLAPLLQHHSITPEEYRFYYWLSTAAVFITEAVFYPIISLFITRKILNRLQAKQPPIKFQLHLRHFLLIVGIGVLLTAIHFTFHTFLTRYILSFREYTSGDLPYILFSTALLLAGGLSQLVALLLFSLVFIMAAPVFIAENIGFSLLFQRVNELVRGKRLKIFAIMLISSAIVWAALSIVLNIGLYALMPRVLQNYGFVGVVLFPIRSFLYAYLFMLPAVIYHHLRFDELKRESE
ncbi:MAG: hypothetical protein P8Y67_01940 [Alphaproteobacteria bacterium]